MKMIFKIFGLSRKACIVSGILFAAIICMVVLHGEALGAKMGTPPAITIGDEDTPDSDAQQGDYFTTGSNDEDVRRVQGEPDNKFFDGERKIWYYGDDAVYFNFHGEVVGIDNKSGKLKFR